MKPSLHIRNKTEQSKISNAHSIILPSIASTTTYSDNLKKEKFIKTFRESLQFKTQESPHFVNKNKIIDNIVSNVDLIYRKKPLLEQIYKLRSMHLLKQRQYTWNQLPGVGKSNFVCNDYHTKSTNNGYQRNFGGVFFTR